MSDNVELIKGTYEAFERGDIDAVVAAMDPEIAWHEAENGPYHQPGGYVGATDVLTNVLGRVATDFDEFRVATDAFHDAGDTVVVEARYRGTAKTTAADLDAQVCHVWHVRDGRVARFQQYTDTWQFARVAGQPPE